MDRIVGIETEYGCLLRKEESHLNSDVWPARNSIAPSSTHAMSRWRISGNIGDFICSVRKG
jgi:hypothetical protein